MTEIELLELGYRKYRGRFIDIYILKRKHALKAAIV